jgi:2-polyprenyl-6-hydroxyphenyl methylase/3-demethylubiquinone-9 3-methyltransferase
MYAESDQRFGFGRNWRRFLSVLNEDRIAEAERSLEAKLGPGAVAGATFLDAGSGSGLFSLAAMRLGAARVHSFDYDPESVACTAELRRRFFLDDPRWTVERGDVLDQGFLDGLDEHDIVYSWGVLHHTGDMWRALANVDALVSPGGLLFIAIYNDQGRRSRVWRRIKRIYNALPRPLRLPYLLAIAVPRELLQLVRSLLRLDPMSYVRAWSEYDRSSRGMSRWRDIVDWVGGYPYEVAGVDEITAFFGARGYEVAALETIGGGSGCNQFVFRATRSSPDAARSSSGSERNRG